MFIDTPNGTWKMNLKKGYYRKRKIRYWLLYLLADGIYPNVSISVKPIHAMKNYMERKMTKRQKVILIDV